MWADESPEPGELDGRAVQLRVWRAIEQLQRTEPKDDADSCNCRSHPPRSDTNDPARAELFGRIVEHAGVGFPARSPNGPERRQTPGRSADLPSTHNATARGHSSRLVDHAR